MDFKNESKPIDRQKQGSGEGSYGFDRAPKNLLLWSHLFQAVISQAGTYILTGKFHQGECGIYKCEGGCSIQGVGDLVLTKDVCYWDMAGGSSGAQVRRMADLITKVVLGWDPNDPIESMLKAAAVCGDATGLTIEGLRLAVTKGSCGGVFGGDALSYFFDRNPFSSLEYDRTYQRFCLVKFNGMTDAEVDRQYADEDLGKDLLGRLQAVVRSEPRNGYSIPMCCSPRRDKNGRLGFWVNTGMFTQIDHWRTREELEAFINGKDHLLKDDRGKGGE